MSHEANDRIIDQELDRLAKATTLESSPVEASDKITNSQIVRLHDSFLYGYLKYKAPDPTLLLLAEMFKDWCYFNLDRYQASELIGYSGGGWQHKQPFDRAAFEARCREWGWDKLTDIKKL